MECFYLFMDFVPLELSEGLRQLKSISYFPPLAAAAAAAEASRPSLNVRDVTRTINPIVVRSREEAKRKSFMQFSH